MFFKNEKFLGSYLAGLWEGDGHINIKNKSLKPSFHITFNIKDLPLAEKLLHIITARCGSTVGSIRLQKSKNACVLNIWSIDGLTIVIGLVQPWLRTPKAYQITVIVDWLNKYNNVKIPKRGLAQTDVSEDAWLAGFIDADGCFSLEWACSLKAQKRLACKFRLAQRMDYTKNAHHCKTLATRYKHIMAVIADYLCVKLNIQKQPRTGRSYYLISMTSVKSKKKIRAYLDKHVLLSSKYLDYKDWCSGDDLMLKQQHYTKRGIQATSKLKKSMNNSRSQFDWGHLDKL